MKSFLLFSHAGPVLILTSLDSIGQPELLSRLSSTYGKFIAHEVPLEAVKACYSEHFEHVINEPKEDSELMVLDVDGKQIFTNVNLKTLGPPFYYDTFNPC